MTRISRRTALAFMATAALVPAGTAQASAPGHAKADTVAAHLVTAKNATASLQRYARVGDSSRALGALRTARHEAAAAARQARGLAANAGDPSSTSVLDTRAVWSLTMTAGQQDLILKAIAALLPQSSGPLQAALAGALPGTLNSRVSLTGSLTSLLGGLHGDPQALAAQALALLGQQAPSNVSTLAAVAQAPGLPVDVNAIVNQALSTATAALATGLQALTNALPALPASVREQITAALSVFTSLLPGLTRMIPASNTPATQSFHGILSSVFVRVQCPAGFRPAVVLIARRRGR